MQWIGLEYAHITKYLPIKTNILFREIKLISESFLRQSYHLNRFMLIFVINIFISFIVGIYFNG